MSTRVVCVTVLGLLITLAASSPALAHTQVVSNDPEEGASLQRAPERVSLTLDSSVEAEFSPLEVYDERDERAAGGINLLDQGKGPFGRMVGAGLLLAFGIFLAAGFLTVLPPSG